MSVALSKTPVLPIIELTKNDSTKYTFNSFTPTFDFRLASLQCSPPFDHVGGTFNMKIISSDATPGALNTLYSNVEEGNEIDVWVGKADDSLKKKIFNGIIEDAVLDQINKNYMTLQISGPDWGSDLLKSKIVNQIWIQQRLADGISLDGADNAVLASQVVDDLLNKLSSYPTSEYTVVDHGIVYSSANVVVPSIRFPQFEANMEFLDDKFVEIDKMIGVTHFVDPNKNFIMRDPTLPTSSSGVLLVDDYTDSIATSWDSTKVGFIGQGATYIKTLENHKRRIYGLGGDNLQLDQKQETDDTSTKIHDKYYAQKFTPVNRTCHTIGILLSKVGSPTINLAFELIEDNGGEPSGEVLRSLSKDKDAIAITAGWHYFDIGEVLNTKQDYWIVLPKVGDTSNTFQWHRDTDTSHTNAEDADGISPWTVNTNSYGFAFREYTSTPILAVRSDFASATSKHFHEQVIKRPDITDMRTMNQLLRVEANTLFKRKEIFKGNIYAPDTILELGQTIRIRQNTSGYTFDYDDFVITNIEYIFESGDESPGSMYYNVEATRLSSY